MKHVVDASAWALVWRDQGRDMIVRDNYIPALFRTRQAAREFAEREYGYIKRRPDLRIPPFCWRMPRPVVVTVAAIIDTPGGRNVG